MKGENVGEKELHNLQGISQGALALRPTAWPGPVASGGMAHATTPLA